MLHTYDSLFHINLMPIYFYLTNLYIKIIIYPHFIMELNDELSYSELTDTNKNSIHSLMEPSQEIASSFVIFGVYINYYSFQAITVIACLINIGWLILFVFLGTDFSQIWQFKILLVAVECIIYILILICLVYWTFTIQSDFIVMLTYIIHFILQLIVHGYVTNTQKNFLLK